MKRTIDINKILKNVARSVPELPYFSRKQSSVVPFVLGAIGVAVFGSVAAVMMFSPRTRYRALGMAKDAYGKVSGQLGQGGIAEKLGISHEERSSAQQPLANGLADRSTSGYSTGL